MWPNMADFGHSRHQMSVRKNKTSEPASWDTDRRRHWSADMAVRAPMKRKVRFLVLLRAAICCISTVTAADNSGVIITEGPGTAKVEINGQLFTEYHFKDA